MSDTIRFKVTYGKTQLNVEINSEASVRDLKVYLEDLTRVPANLQKLFLKGPLKNEEAKLMDLKLRESSKILLVGSTASEISETSNIRTGIEEEKKFDLVHDGFSADQMRIIEKGPPGDCIPANLLANAEVPDTVPGLYNHLGANIRLTVKKETDELWIVNNANTRKIPFGAIANITFIPILKYPGYTVLTLELGPKNKYNIYFFPSQFIRSLKTLVCPFYINGLDFP